MITILGIPTKYWEIPRVVKVISTGMRNQIPVALLRSLLDKYPWERYEPPYPPNYGLNSITAKYGFRIKKPTNIDMPLKKKT